MTSPDKALCLTRITLGTAGGNENQIEHRVTLCRDEDQALAELERQAMRAVAPNGFTFNMSRGDDWIKVATHTDDGRPGPVHYFSIQETTRSSA